LNWLGLLDRLDGYEKLSLQDCGKGSVIVAALAARNRRLQSLDESFYQTESMKQACVSNPESLNNN
jgi:hypothetical protein